MRLARDKDRPIQFVFAGKAHPRDDDGKRYIQHIIHLSKYSDLQGHLVFIENYDVHVARQMVSGCDVWLNTPRRPLEASGTSGMKAGCHGCLNLSILDGWWREGYDGTNGFAIGEDSHADSVEQQDRVDSANLYKVLTQEVIPLFYQRDAQGIPRQWIQRIRRAMVTLVPQFTTGAWCGNMPRNITCRSKRPALLVRLPAVPADIKSQTAEELAAQFQAWGQPAYRVAQLLEWLYVHRATSWEAMTNLPKALRDRLRSHYSLATLELVRQQGSPDTTQKFLWRLSDHALIESVLIPANPALYGEPSDRHTLCVSTQVGCAYGCKFCASGLAGWKRNLGVEEIVDQVLAVERGMGRGSK